MKLTPTVKKKLTAKFKAEISDRAASVDPNKEHDWWCLTFGWAIAKGLTPKDAAGFATYIRYNTDLG